jgi:hypothetical protein
VRESRAGEKPGDSRGEVPAVAKFSSNETGSSSNETPRFLLCTFHITHMSVMTECASLTRMHAFLWARFLRHIRYRGFMHTYSNNCVLDASWARAYLHARVCPMCAHACYVYLKGPVRCLVRARLRTSLCLSRLNLFRQPPRLPYAPY